MPDGGRKAETGSLHRGPGRAAGARGFAIAVSARLVTWTRKITPDCLHATACDGRPPAGRQLPLTARRHALGAPSAWPCRPRVGKGSERALPGVPAARLVQPATREGSRTMTQELREMR